LDEEEEGFEARGSGTTEDEEGGVIENTNAPPGPEVEGEEEEVAGV